MKITIRTRATKDGSRSIYLDFYEKGKRWYEYLNLYLVPGKATEAKRLNEIAMAKANEIKSKRMLGIEDEPSVDDTGKPILPRRVFADWLADYIENIRRSPHYAKSTYLNHCSTVNIINSYLKYKRRPRMLMSKIDKRFILGFLDYIQNIYLNTKSPERPQKLATQTTFLIQSTLVRMLNAAVKEGVIGSNPFYSISKIERIHREQPERDYLTREEVIALSEAPTVNETTKRAFLFCCFTGLRYSDVSNLLWRDIRHDNSGVVISIRSMKKTRKPLVIPLNKTALSYLPERNDSKPTQRVFNMTVLSKSNRCLKKMAKAANIEKNISFHTSRHTFAVLTLAAGGDIYTLSKLLGHIDIKTTQIYADVVMDAKVDAVNRVSDFFAKLHRKSNA